MEGVTELAELLRTRRQALMTHWRERVTALRPAGALDRSALIDHVPQLIDALAEMLLSAGDGELPQPVPGAPRHGVTRLHDGYDIDDVVAELSILRTSVLLLADESGLPTKGRALRVFDAALDQLIGDAVAGFAAAAAAMLGRQQEQHLAFVAHDLRTPLGAIALSLAALERALPQGEPGGVVPRMLQSLRRNVNRLTQRVDEVLATDASGKTRKLAVPLQLRPLIETLVKGLEEQARAAGTGVVIEVPAEIELHADAALLGRAIENLLVNAIEFAPNSTVTIGAAHGDGRVRCWVRDQGVGIDDERLARIFDAGESTRLRDGHHGLGLAIAREFVTAHGGRIDVHRGDDGTVFQIELPAEPMQDSPS